MYMLYSSGNKIATTYDTYRKQNSKLSELTLDDTSCHILAFPHTDHKAVHIGIATESIPKKCKLEQELNG